MKYIRLRFITSLINKDERVLDVGTDHALLPIFLVQEGVTKNVVASDLNKEPLNAAIDNIKENNLEDVIETKLMNGVEDVKEGDYDTIVVAGMGGTTIATLLKNLNCRYIIHSTTNLSEVRERISELGMKISDEWVIKEGKVHNVIIEAIPGESKYNEQELFMGPVLMNKVDNSTVEYQEHLYNILERNSQLSGDDKLKQEERNWLKEKLWTEKN